MTSFENKCKILAELWSDEVFEPQFKELFDDYNLSFPYAFGLHHEHILRLSDESEQSIETLFDMVLAIAQKSDTGFTSVYDVIELD